MGKRIQLHPPSNMECLTDTPPKRVIFLDIDGVMNNEECMIHGEMINIKLARIVRRISRVARADIVVSSTWRIGNSTHTLREMLYPFGLYRVIGRTSDNQFGDRGDEIKEWLDANPSVEQYVILDDDDDMLPEQKPNFIKTNANFGITHEDSNRAIAVFGSFDVCKACDGYARVGDAKCGLCRNQYQ